MSKILKTILVAVAAMSAAFSLTSCDNEKESIVFLFADDIKSTKRDTVLSGDHQVYEVYARTLNQRIVSISLTESGTNGLKEVERVVEDDGSEKSALLGRKEVKGFRFDYETPVIYREPTAVKDTISIFTMLFEAKDDTGEVQNFKRTLYIIKKELKDGE